MPESIFNEVEADALKELINIGVGKGASSLNQILESHVHLEVPHLKVVSVNQFISNFQIKNENEPISAVHMAFHGELSGNASLMFPKNNAYKLVSAMLGSALLEEDVEALVASTIHEIGNILINSVMGTLGNILKKHVDYTPPIYNESSVEAMKHLYKEGVLVLVNTRFSVESLSIFGDILLTFEVESIESMKRLLQEMISSYK